MNDSWRTIHNPAIKDTMTFLRTSEETGGELTELEIELAPGGGNPLHYHGSYSERFEVIEGMLGVQTGRTQRTLAPGEHVLVEAHTRHRFFNPTQEPVRFRVELRPASLRAEQGFRILYGLARDGKTNAASIPRSLPHLAVMIALTDMYAAGPLGLLQPLLNLLAKRARKNGLEQTLIEAYCTPPANLPR